MKRLIEDDIVTLVAIAVMEDYFDLLDCLRNPRVFVAVDDMKNMAAMMLPVSGGVYDLHYYIRPGFRVSIRDQREFSRECGLALKKFDPGLQAAMNIVKKKDRRLRLMMPFLGAKKAADLPNGDTVFFTTTEVLGE